MCYLSDRKEAFKCNVGEFDASRIKIQCEYSPLYLFVIFPRYTVFLSSTSITSCKHCVHLCRGVTGRTPSMTPLPRKCQTHLHVRHPIITNLLAHCYTVVEDVTATIQVTLF